MTFPNAVQQTFKYRSLLKNLVLKDLKLRYRNSALGFFWSILDPTLSAAVFILVFSVIIRWDVENYPLFLLCGAFPWAFFRYSVAASADSIVRNAGLVSRLNFPRETLPLSVVAAAAVNFSAQLLILILVAAFFGFPPGPGILALPLVVALHCLLCVGLAFFVSAASVFVRDMGYVIDVTLNLWFYLSPVFYPSEMVKEVEWLYPFFRLNPMTGILNAYRAAIYGGAPAGWADLAPALGAGLALVYFGHRFFKSRERRFVECL